MDKNEGKNFVSTFLLSFISMLETWIELGTDGNRNGSSKVGSFSSSFILFSLSLSSLSFPSFLHAFIFSFFSFQT